MKTPAPPDRFGINSGSRFQYCLLGGRVRDQRGDAWSPGSHPPFRLRGADGL